MTTDPRIDALVEMHPRLFKGRPPRSWSDLPAGWTEIVRCLFADLDAMLSDAQAASLEILQIKEKFAGLRVYWSLGQSKTLAVDLFAPGSVERLEARPRRPSAVFTQIAERVRQAEVQAAQTCRHCGQPDTRRQLSGWLLTLCAPCMALQPQEAP